MQNWSPWQLSAGAVATPMPQPPVGADPMAMMQTYMQLYNQPAPSGYTAEQWAAAQQQSWTQWQQWQQQYQQWQAQYGEKYEETVKHMSVNMSSASQIPQLPVSQPPPPLPKEDAKPPLPPTTTNAYQFTNMPPPHQNNLPLFPAKQGSSTSSVEIPQNPPLPPSQPPLPPPISNSNEHNSLKRASTSISESSSEKKMKIEEDLTAAEKSFDDQFKEWEDRFNKWKQQNANHPDKTQYKEYEAKWTAWREKLIERREQMRKKREQQKQATSPAVKEAEKPKTLTGDDKIMNILSSTENQGLINNLLGIGKTLGLTGKQNVPPPPPPPPPPATETATSNVPTAPVATSSSQLTPQSSAAQQPVMNMTPSGAFTSSPWNQQWAPQYGANVPNFPNFPPMTGAPPLPFNTPGNQMPNVTQPPPNFSVPNFSQPPPGFNDSRQNNNARPQVPSTAQGRPPPFSPNTSNSSDGNLMQNERSNQTGLMSGFDSPGNFRQKEGMPSERFGRDSEQQSNQFRSNDMFQRNENERVSDTDQFRRDDRSYQEHGSNQFNQQKMNFNNDRFGPGNDRFGSGNRFGPTNDRFGNDRFGVGNDRFGPGDNRFVPGNDRFGSGPDRAGNEPLIDRFGVSNEFHDRFRSTVDQKDMGDRRDSFSNIRGNFNRNNQFEPSDKLRPELRKLMEKRRAAMDVFKPSFLDFDKNSDKLNVGSLSESFKKITGDSLFMKSSGSSNFGSRGPSNFGPRGPQNFGPGNFRPPGDFKPQGNLEFGPRGATGIGRNSSFDGGAVPLRGPNSSPQRMQDFMNTESKQETMNQGNNMDTNNENKHAIEQTPPIRAPEQNIDTPKQPPETYSEPKDIQLLEKPPWVAAQLSENDPLQMNDTKNNENPIETYGSSEQNSQNVINESTDSKEGSKQENQLHDDNSINKKNDVLPFMGENDPKPEDLNLEPPPELPNLCSVPMNEPIPQKTNDPYDTKESSLKPPSINVESFDSRDSSDPSIAPRGIQFRPNAPFFGPRGSNDGRFPPLESKVPNRLPFNSPGSNSYPLGPRGLNDGQFGPRGPNNMQFGPRGPVDGQFGPRGSADGQFGPRGSADGQFGPRGPGDGQFGPRGPGDGQFGSRGSNDGQLGSRSANDGQFGPRGPTDSQFGPRGSNNAQFDSRNPTVGQFGSSRYDNQLGLRRSNDGQFGSQGLNRPAGFGRPNDVPFDNRGPSDPQFMSRGPNEAQSRILGLNDRPFLSRRNDLPYEQNPSSKGDRQFRFNENPDFGSNDSFGQRDPVPGASSSPFAPRSSVDRQFDVRGIGEFRQKGSADGSKIPETSEGGYNNKPNINPNMPQRPFDANDMQNPGWKQPYPMNIGDLDQRSGRDFNYSDKPMLAQNDPLNQGSVNNMQHRSSMSGNQSNMPDKRGMAESPDYGNSNMYMKQPVDNRQSQVGCQPVKEFCIQQQFNYNHGGVSSDKKFIDHIPAKVIDYAHTSRTTIHNLVTPVQCFDYGHGNLKPQVTEHEVHPKRDFRNWEENEQNLKEYTEKVRSYEHFASRTEFRRPGGDYKPRRSSEEFMIGDRKPEKGRRGKEDYIAKEKRDNRMPEKAQENRYDNNSSKEGARERCETSQKSTTKENEKDEDRSKGNKNWQENSNKNVLDTKPMDTSVTDSQQNVLEPAKKTLELAKTPNCSMVDDLLCPPGRQNRPPKIVIILRGPPGSGKSFVAKLIKDREIEQGGSPPRILSLDDYFLIEKEVETDDNGKKVTIKEMVYEYEEAMEQSYIASLVKAFKKNIIDGFFNFIILDCINEKISDYEEMWSFAKTKGFKVYVCEMEMDLQICLKRNIHGRTEDEINKIIDYFEPTPSYHQKLDVNSMLQDQAIEEVHMEDTEEMQEKPIEQNEEDSQDSLDDTQETIGISKWERMEAEDKLDRLDGLARKKTEGKVQTMQDFLQVPDYYNMEDTSGKKHVRWADLEERKEQEKMRAVGFVVGHTNWDRMMDPTKGGSALTRTKYI